MPPAPSRNLLVSPAPSSNDKARQTRLVKTSEVSTEKTILRQVRDREGAITSIEHAERRSLPPACCVTCSIASDPEKSWRANSVCLLAKAFGVCRLARHGTGGAERKMVQTLSGNDRLWRRRTGEDVLNREASADRKGSLLTFRRCAVSTSHDSRFAVFRGLVTFPLDAPCPLLPAVSHWRSIMCRLANHELRTPRETALTSDF